MTEGAKGKKKGDPHRIGELKEYYMDTLVCTYCGFCKSVCPTFRLTKDDTRSPRAKTMLSYGILNKDFEPDASVRDAIYMCTTCADCMRRCPSKVKTTDIVMAARRVLASKGLIPEGERKVLENIAREQNPLGEPRDKRTEFVPKEAMTRVGKGAEILVFLGCNMSFTEMKLVKLTFEVLERAKVDYTYLGRDEPCCGMMNYLVGFGVEGFAKAMRERIDGLKPRPATVVTPCPGCYRSFAQNYADHLDLGVTVKHTLQFFLELIETGKLRVSKKLEGKVFYHDPCDLGRHANIYEEPRKLLGHFAQVNEFQYNRTQSHCCGGGGGLQAANYDMAMGIAKGRLMEAIDNGADIVVTACPSCKDAFSNALAEMKKDPIKRPKIMDLTEIVAKNTVAGA